MASFPNTDQRLWPGQFSNVLLRLGQQQNVLVVPSQAVQAGQQGDYVFVTKPDMTVDVRQVKVGQTVNNETEILQGLSARRNRGHRRAGAPGSGHQSLFHQGTLTGWNHA